MKHTVFHAPADWRPHDLLKTMFVKSKGKKKSKRIGEGAFATAYWVPSLNSVVKIGDLSDPYLDYVRSIKTSRSNKYKAFFPKITQVIECHESGSDWDDMEGAYVVMMERLQEKHKPKFEAVRAVVADSFWGGDTGDYDEDDIVRHRGASALLKKAIKAAKHVDRLCGSYGHDLDMHDGNILFRKNGQLVITDPFC